MASPGSQRKQHGKGETRATLVVEIRKTGSEELVVRVYHIMMDGILIADEMIFTWVNASQNVGYSCCKA